MCVYVLKFRCVASTHKDSVANPLQVTKLMESDFCCCNLFFAHNFISFAVLFLFLFLFLILFNFEIAPRVCYTLFDLFFCFCFCFSVLFYSTLTHFLPELRKIFWTQYTRVPICFRWQRQTAKCNVDAFYAFLKRK